jgi:hypothetical protein
MPKDKQCDMCLCSLESNHALLKGAVRPYGAGMTRTDRLRVCPVCWDKISSMIVFSKRMAKRMEGRKPVEPCPEADWPAPNDID